MGLLALVTFPLPPRGQPGTELRRAVAQWRVRAESTGEHRVQEPTATLDHRRQRPRPQDRVEARESEVQQYEISAVGPVGS
jgi:hypothetical protein